MISLSRAGLRRYMCIYNYLYIYIYALYWVKFCGTNETSKSINDSLDNIYTVWKAVLWRGSWMVKSTWSTSHSMTDYLVWMHNVLCALLQSVLLIKRQTVGIFFFFVNLFIAVADNGFDFWCPHVLENYCLLISPCARE